MLKQPAQQKGRIAFSLINSNPLISTIWPHNAQSGFDGLLGI